MLWEVRETKAGLAGDGNEVAVMERHALGSPTVCSRRLDSGCHDAAGPDKVGMVGSSPALGLLEMAISRGRSMDLEPELDGEMPGRDLSMH